MAAYDDVVGILEVEIKTAHFEKLYRPTVVAIVEDADGRILFVQSAKNDRDWHLPQGGIEEGEDALTALLREVQEEVGITKNQILAFEYRGSRLLNAEAGRRDRRGFALGKKYFFFGVQYTGPEILKLQYDELCSYQWIEKDAVVDLLARVRPEKRMMLLEVLSTGGSFSDMT